MAHQIETHGDQAAAVFARTDAWHRLGTVVHQRAFSAEEAMRLGHLGGWNVRKVPVHATETTETGVTTIEAPGFATVRTNPFTHEPEALGIVGAAYEPLQNEDHADFLNTLTDQSGAIFDTAGSLRGGRQVFITMQLPESITVGGTDRVDLKIAALNSHDGSSKFRLLVTPVRVVCANTQSAALRDHEASFSIRHTRNAHTAVQEVREALGMTFAYVEAFEAEAERLIQTSMTESAFNDLITTVFGQPEQDAPTRTRKTPTPSAARPCTGSTPTPIPSAPSRAPRGRATRPSRSTSTTTPRSAPGPTPPTRGPPGCSPVRSPPTSSAGPGPPSAPPDSTVAARRLPRSSRRHPDLPTDDPAQPRPHLPKEDAMSQPTPRTECTAGSRRDPRLGPLCDLDCDLALIEHRLRSVRGRGPSLDLDLDATLDAAIEQVGLARDRIFLTHQARTA